MKLESPYQQTFFNLTKQLSLEPMLGFFPPLCKYPVYTQQPCCNLIAIYQPIHHLSLAYIYKKCERNQDLIIGGEKRLSLYQKFSDEASQFLKGKILC